MTVPNPAQERAYPLTALADDRRFTLGLVFAIAQVLADAGYPPIAAGGDLVALQQAVYGFLYRPASHGVAQVREVIDGLGPVPAGVDQETAAALRRIAQHFRDHGCLTWTPAEAESDSVSMCYGAPAGFEASCGRPGPHGEHPLATLPVEDGAR